jgi:hypothetical protein
VDEFPAKILLMMLMLLATHATDRSNFFENRFQNEDTQIDEAERPFGRHFYKKWSRTIIIKKSWS